MESVLGEENSLWYEGFVKQIGLSQRRKNNFVEVMMNDERENQQRKML